MNDREKAVLRMLVIFGIPNLDDVIEAFETEESQESNPPVRKLSVDGCVIDAPTEEELSLLLKMF